MDGVDRDEAIALLRRAPVLETCRDEPLARSQLTDHADLSRTTAYRATTELVDQGLLTETGGGYLTTPRGEALLAASDNFLAGVGTIDRLESLFELIDHSELTEHAHLLADGKVVEADPSNPYRVVERVLERWEGISRSRGLITNPTAAEAIEEATPDMDEKESIERIFSESALAAHDTVGGEGFRAATESDVFSVLVAPDDALPFSFAIDDDDVTVFGHDPTTGLPTVHVESTNDAARTWLEGLYEECREQATPVEIS